MKAYFSLKGALCPRIKQSPYTPISIFKSATTTFLIVFCFVFAAKAQEGGVHSPPVAKAETEIMPLKIGDKIPDELWDVPLQVVNHPKGKKTITLNEYRGKLIILDFWATWCSACLAAFPKNNSILTEYQDQVQILLVNTELKKKPSDISSFLNEYSRTHHTSLLQTSIVRDSILKKIIPFKLIPHYTWIDKDGRIMAATSSDGIKSNTIAKILKGEHVLFDNKLDRMSFNVNNAFLFDRDIIEKAEIKFGSALSRGMKGLPGMSFLSINIEDPVTRIFMINASPLTMLLRAFQLEGRFNNNRIVLDVENPLKYTFYPDQGVEQEDWKIDNTYSYELYSPAKTKDKILKKFQDDLLEFFSLRVTVEHRVMECWKLTTDEDKLEHFVNRESSSEKAKKRNRQTITSIVSLLNFKLPIPVINGSSYLGEIALNIPEDLSDTGKVFSVLESAGIYLKKEKKTFPVFVVTEVN